MNTRPYGGHFTQLPLPDQTRTHTRQLWTLARTGATSPGLLSPGFLSAKLSLPEQNIHSPALDEHSPVRGLPYPSFHFQARTHTLARVGTGTLTPYGGHLAFLPSSFPFPSPAPVHPAFFPEHTPTSSEHSGGSGHSPVREPLYPASTARPKHTLASSGYLPVRGPLHPASTARPEDTYSPAWEHLPVRGPLHPAFTLTPGLPGCIHSPA
jgi:hypothetical protein